MIVYCENCDAANKVPQVNDNKPNKQYTCHQCGESLSKLKKSSTTSSYPSQGSIVFSERIAWRESLLTKMSLILIIITSTVFCGFVFYNHLVAKDQKSTKLMELSEITCQRLAKALSDPLWNIDKTRLDDLLASEMSEKRIYGVVIKDDENQSIIFGKKRNKEWEVVNVKAQIGDGFIKNRAPIIHGSNVIGALEVFFTTRFMDIELRQSIIDLVANAIILNIAIFLTTILSMRKMIIKPIQQLSEATLQMSKGDLSTQFESNFKGEIGLLSQSIERVQTSMRMALDRIKKRN